MSVMITLKFDVSAEAMEEVITAHRETALAIIEDAKQKGATHHQFVVDADDGNTLVIDEWPDFETFRQFYAGQEDIPKIIAAAGVTTEPQVTAYTILETPDRF